MCSLSYNDAKNAVCCGKNTDRHNIGSADPEDYDIWTKTH